MLSESELLNELALRAMESVLELRLDDALTNTMVDDQSIPAAHWRGHSAGTVRMQRLLLYLVRHREPQSIEMIARYVWPNTANPLQKSRNSRADFASRD